MKLTFFLLTTVLMNVYAHTAAQTITLTGNNIPFKRVISEVEKQTGYVVLTTKKLLNNTKPVSLSVYDMPLTDFLEVVLRDQPLNYQISEKSILLVRKESKDSSRNSIPISSPVEDTTILLTVTGKITAADGTPLPGATVMIKGTQQGAITDADGKFSLPKVLKDAVLVVTSVGYETMEIPVKGKSVLAQLNVDLNELDETVVIAYGTTTKRFNTGNVTTIKGEDITKQPVSNPLLALQGRVPGLFIEQATGLPGSGVKVRIQGQNSINNGNDPLYVIDGVPYSSQLLSSINSVLLGGSGTGGITGNPFSYINPADIESIDILKDADATAIYGSRAANGAILITTKKGKAGQTKTDINLQSGWGKVTRKLNLMDAKQYLEMRHEALTNDGIASPSTTDYDLNGLWDTSRSTNWQKELIGGVTKYTDIQVSVSGGSANTQFLVGAGYHKETTVFPGDFSDQKGSVHFNINNASANQKFRLQLSGNYLVDNNQLPDVDLSSSAIHLAPVAPLLYNPDGSLNWMPDASGTSTWTNPLAALNNRYKNKTSNLVSNALVSYQIIPGLDIKSSFGITNLQSNEIQLFPLTAKSPEERPFATRIARYGNNEINSWTIEPQVSYKRTFGKGKLETLIGTSILQTNSIGKQLYGYGYNSDLVLEDIGAAPNTVVASTLKSVYKYNAIFGRVNYNYKDKYILNLTARRDGSSRFGKKNQFHNFGAVGGAWIFNEETFFREKLPFLSFGKLRASYGTTGSDQVGDYRFLNLYRPVTTDVAYQGTTGLKVDGLPNPYLQWEETRKLQIGLDLGWLRDRLLLNVNYFNNRCSNQLLGYGLPITTGFSVIDRNFPATLQNRGWEVSLNTINLKTNDFTWTTNINFTSYRNKLAAFPNIENSTYANRYIVGKPITYIKVYHFLGADPQTGKFQFADKEGKPTSSPDPTTDNTVLIDVNPQFYGGFQNSFRYKGFQLDILFQFVKQKGQNYSLGQIPGFFLGGYGNQPISVLNRWQKPGDIASNQRYTSSDFSLFEPFFNASGSSDATWSDASYIRLKNFSLSWQLPGNWGNKLYLKNAKLYVQGQNLITITNYPGLDPENRSTASLPPLRVITVGVQMGL